MDTLDKYLVKEYLTYFVFLLVGLSALYLGIDLFSKFWNIRLPSDKIFLLYLYKIPEALQQFLPVACLMATLLVLTTMSRQKEILALYSGGVSTFRIASTFVAVVALLSTISFISFDNIAPAYARKQLLIQTNQDPNAENQSHDPTRFWYRSGNRIYNVGTYFPESRTMTNVNVYLLNPKFQLIERIWAESARYVEEEHDWAFRNGFVVRYPTEHYPVGTPFEHKKGIIPEAPKDFSSFSLNERTMRLRELRHYINRLSNYGLDSTATRVQYHERIAFVFTPMIFVLIAIPFGTRPLQTQTIGRSIGYCFLLVFLYLLVFRFALTVGKGGHLPPLVAAWFTNVVFLSYAVLKLWRR